MASNTRGQRAQDVHRRHEAHRHEHEHGGHAPHDRHNEHDYSPFSLMRQGIDEMDRWFRRFGSSSSSWMPSTGQNAPSWASPSAWMESAQKVMGDWTPAIEAFQRGNEFVVRAEVPGMTRTDLHVEAGDDTITIRGERKQEQQHEDQDNAMFWTERRYGSFSRVIPVPPGTITDSAKATFNNGMLEVVMQAPSQEARRGRRIDISGGADPTK
jgi:HSP20 family protein